MVSRGAGSQVREQYVLPAWNPGTLSLGSSTVRNTFKEKLYGDEHIANRDLGDFADWRRSSVALQPKLGVLPERVDRPGDFDFPIAVLNWSPVTVEPGLPEPEAEHLRLEEWRDPCR